MPLGCDCDGEWEFVVSVKPLFPHISHAYLFSCSLCRFSFILCAVRDKARQMYSFLNDNEQIRKSRAEAKKHVVCFVIMIL